MQEMQRQRSAASKPEETMAETVARLEREMGCKIVAVKGERQDG
jgi:hypothetical protein